MDSSHLWPFKIQALYDLGVNVCYWYELCDYIIQ